MSECDCSPAQVHWDPDNVRFDEHQAVVPGVCSACGQDVEYVYNEAGVRTPDGEYLQEF